jgi:hypothetical protein
MPSLAAEMSRLVADDGGDAATHREGSIGVDVDGLSAPAAEPSQESCSQTLGTRLAVDEGCLEEKKGAERLERMSNAFNSPKAES